MPDNACNEFQQPSLLLVLHDVTPQTWADYQPFVEAVDAIGSVPMTLLVVPDFHRHNALDGNAPFRRILEKRLARGDELALHGYSHADESQAPRSPREYFMRRIYTWEGEFYDLSRDQAMARLQAGIALFEHFGWPLHGFVAPAWLMSQGTREALSSLPLAYTSAPQTLFRLPDFSPVPAPGLVWSARSAWRRGVSRLACDARELRLRKARTIRLGLHPVDMRHRFSRDYWLELLQRLLAQGREPMTKAAWLASQAGA